MRFANIVLADFLLVENLIADEFSPTTAAPILQPQEAYHPKILGQLLLL
jgi:hypothetical protein